MASEDTAGDEAAPKQLTFKIKTSGEGAHNITISETAQVIELKNLLSGESYENIPASRQRLIYSGRVMKDDEQLKVYKIKDGNTVHMVKSAASNAAQKPANTSASGSSSTPQATGVPTNMAAGTANNPLAGLTGARYAGHMGLPGMDMFGADGGVRFRTLCEGVC
jgi:ubiquilin